MKYQIIEVDGVLQFKKHHNFEYFSFSDELSDADVKAILNDPNKITFKVDDNGQVYQAP